MRHHKGYRKLRRDTAHRMALLRNLVTSLIEHERIVTTVAKAKEAQRLAEKMITLARKGTLHHRRMAYAFIYKKEAVRKLFDILGPRFADRNGGYTRIIRLAKRRKGDGAELAILEFVDYEFKPKEKSQKTATP